MARKAPGELTDRQRLFVAEYLIDLNATQAYIRAGYSPRGANRSGPKLLSNPVIQAAVQAGADQRLRTAKIDSVSVLEEIRRVAFAKMTNFATWGPDGISLKPCGDLTEDDAVSVAELSQTVGATGGGSVRFKLHSKLDALRMLALHLKLLTNIHEHSGKDGGPIDIAGGLTDEQRLAQIAALFDAVRAREAGRIAAPDSAPPVVPAARPPDTRLP